MADSIPLCFRAAANQTSTNSNLITSLYHTAHGPVVLTWSRTVVYNTLSIDIHIDHNENSHKIHGGESSFNDASIASFRLHLNPWLFWKKKGSETFYLGNKNHGRSVARIEFHWDLSRAKFLSGPEPHSGFFVAVVYNGQMLLLIGDSPEAAYSKTKSCKLLKHPPLVMRREHVFGSKSYTTRANIGGKARDILIECGGSRDESRLSMSIDRKRVLHVKRLKWKFRGNEKFNYDGVPVQVFWDVHNWLFDDDGDDRHAVFIFRFEKEIGVEEDFYGKKGLGTWKVFGLGLEGLEREKMKMKRKKSLLKTMSSSSSSSSASSQGSSSVMEWASSEEGEMQSTGEGDKCTHECKPTRRWFTARS